MRTFVIATLLFFISVFAIYHFLEPDFLYFSVGKCSGIIVALSCFSALFGALTSLYFGNHLKFERVNTAKVYPVKLYRQSENIYKIAWNEKEDGVIGDNDDTFELFFDSTGEDVTCEPLDIVNGEVQRGLEVTTQTPSPSAKKWFFTGDNKAYRLLADRDTYEIGKVVMVA